MLYYIHGYLSGPNSTKGNLLKNKLGVKPIKYRDVPPEKLVISDCISEIQKNIKHDNNVTLIGSSLGGFLAVKTAMDNKNIKQMILLNPAVIPPYVDINKIEGMPLRILQDMKDEQLFQTKINCDIYMLIGTLDEVVPNKWGIEFAQAQEAYVKFLHDDHSFNQQLDKIPVIIADLLKEKH